MAKKFQAYAYTNHGRTTDIHVIKCYMFHVSQGGSRRFRHVIVPYVRDIGPFAALNPFLSNSDKLPLFGFIFLLLLRTLSLHLTKEYHTSVFGWFGFLVRGFGLGFLLGCVVVYVDSWWVAW
ncbi:hypothetical protein BDV36DRAFT_276672 [Aspergillus pseudocaelatus]|uniref:Uncharacterized protein n=1 Tax=Aspergillus pseudocaelatus TaxID=1825620 RepID=A0ABQ6W5W8_9EURO|nr:hypothetical protein BDV36DRAFT_276672 [Aspergillus pseudocaelatus]